MIPNMSVVQQDCGWRSVTFTTRVTWHDPHRKYLGSTEAPHTSQSESAKPRRTYQWDSGILEWFDSGTVQKIHRQFVQSCAESEWKRRQCIWALNYYDHLDTKLHVFGLLNCVLLWVTYSYVSNVISLYSDWLAFSSKSVILFIRVLNYSLVSVNRYDLYIVYLTNGEKSVKLYKVLFKYLICF